MVFLQSKAAKSAGQNFSIIHLEPDRVSSKVSSTSLIDAAFIKLTSDNDKRTNALEN